LSKKAEKKFQLEQFDFETIPPALYCETSFAYACGAGGGTRRQSISTFSMLKCSRADHV
jgi:hypothetical protein